MKKKNKDIHCPFRNLSFGEDFRDGSGTKDSETGECLEERCSLWISGEEIRTSEGLKYGEGMCSLRFMAMKNRDGKIPV